MTAHKTTACVQEKEHTQDIHRLWKTLGFLVLVEGLLLLEFFWPSLDLNRGQKTPKLTGNRSNSLLVLGKQVKYE